MGPRASSGPLARWVVFSADFRTNNFAVTVPRTDEGHLVIEVSPTPVPPQRLFFHTRGEGGQLHAVGTVQIWSVEGTWYEVLYGSIFSGHLVLVWTRGAHTIAVGFHRWTRASRTLGLAVARDMVLVPPP